MSAGCLADPAIDDDNERHTGRVNRRSCGWLVTMLTALSESDCELIRGGLFAQPVNALTSLAFIVVGLVVAFRGRRERTSTSLGFAVLLVTVGVGSVAFHGPQPPESQLLHDTSIHLLLAFIVLRRVRARLASVSLWALTTVGAASVLVAATVPGFTTALTALLAAAALLVEVRWHALHSQPWSERRITLAFAAVLAVAGFSFVLGRTGAPTCDPLSWVQFHGLWHVSVATAFGLWWWQLEPSAKGSEPAAEAAERSPGPHRRA